jgi:hypothetical protein
MDPGSKEYQDIASALGGSEETRGLVLGAASQRHALREMTGKGRRGAHGQADSILGLATGGALSEMNFSVGGRSLRANSTTLMRLLGKDGGPGDDIETQMASQLAELGVSEAASKVKDLRSRLKGGVTGDEAKSLYDKFANDPELQRVRREGVERMQQANDPLGVQRNTLLTEIRGGINRLVEKINPDNMSQSTPPG